MDTWKVYMTSTWISDKIGWKKRKKTEIFSEKDADVEESMNNFVVNSFQKKQRYYFFGMSMAGHVKATDKYLVYDTTLQTQWEIIAMLYTASKYIYYLSWLVVIITYLTGIS